METERPWTLADRYDEAERMAKAGCSVDEISERCSLVRVSAACIVGRVRGEFDPASLKRGELTEAGRRMRLMIMGKDPD